MKFGLALLALAATAQAAVHINRTVEAVSHLGKIEVDEDGHMWLVGQYIVKFAKHVDEAARDAHIAALPEGALQTRWEGKKFFAYAAHFDDETFAKIEQSTDVQYVERNGIAWALGVEEETKDCAPAIPMVAGVWGTIRTNNLGLTITGDYFEELGAGANVHSYMIDTGIDTTHNAFGGRASWGIDYTGEGENDGNGHGTHCAGTMMGDGYGIAQEADIKAVKVLGASGGGSWQNVISGILWCATHAEQGGNRGKGVNNLSLGGGFNQAVHDAIEEVFDRGIISVVAAGNNGGDACNLSPAAAVDSVTVGSSTNTDSRSGFSSWGCCVDIYAPGSAILSTLPGQRTAVYSGTSMAAPHVAGVITYFWSLNPGEETRAIKRDILQWQSNPDRLTGGTFSGTCPTRCLGHDGCIDGQWSNNILAYARCLV